MVRNKQERKSRTANASALKRHRSGVERQGERERGKELSAVSVCKHPSPRRKRQTCCRTDVEVSFFLRIRLSVHGQRRERREKEKPLGLCHGGLLYTQTLQLQSSSHSLAGILLSSAGCRCCAFQAPAALFAVLLYTV